MASTSPTSPAPGAAAGDDPAGRPAPRPQRRLPGPLAMVVIVLIAALAGLTVLSVAARSAGDGDAVDLRAALDQVDVSAPVPAGAEVAAVGRPAPDVQLAYLDGGVQRLSELRGRPVVLNFWSSTCAPCLEEMPAFQAVSEQLEDRVTVLGIGVADTEADGREMVERTGVRYRNARDPRSEIFGVFGGTALPRTVLLDADGTVVATHSGALDEAELLDLLRSNDLA